MTALQKSAPTQNIDDKPLLHTGESLHQIFSDKAVIFKMTDTRKTLVRYKYNENNSNAVEEKVIYKRVPPEDPRISELSKAKSCRKLGNTESFIGGVKYDIYALFAKVIYPENDKPKYTGFKGYRVVPRTKRRAQKSNTLQPSEDLYFVYEQKEVK